MRPEMASLSGLPVLDLLRLALGIELTVVGQQPLQALPGISGRARYSEIIGEAFEHKRVAPGRQWNLRICAPDFIHVMVVTSRRRSIRSRNIAYNPIVIDT